jgi:uncharacterized membrane protein YkoI
MRTMFIPIVPALLALVIFPGFAQEKKIQKKDVPPAVLSAFTRAYPKAVIKGTSTEKEEGKTCYEIESVEGTTTRDILYSADGTVVETEEGLALSDLPEAVAKSAAKEFPGAKITRAERSTHGDKVAYELRIMTGKKAKEVVFDVNGAVVKK